MIPEVVELMLHRNSVVVEDALKQYYDEDADIQSLLNAERYSLFAGGKRIRPTLTLEVCRMFGGEEAAALPFACAVEMIHTYSLIHDDLPCMDDDDLRRGKPTNHKVFGESTALLAGDALLTGAFEVAASNREAGTEISAKAVAYLANAAGRYGMVGGQLMDLEGEAREMTLEELIKMHSLKTGALIGASAVLGALAAGISFSSSQMKDVLSYAENVGLAFQILDDVLDRTGERELLGKNVGVDAAHQKNTFLRFFSVEDAGLYAERLTQEATLSLRKYPDSDPLCSLAEWLLTRKK